MFNKFKQDWEALKASDPGHRFQDRYHRRRERYAKESNLRKFFVVIIGFLIISVGILLLLFPGPGWVTITVGIAFMAGESLILAKILDIGELIIRKLLGMRGHNDK